MLLAALDVIMPWHVLVVCVCAVQRSHFDRLVAVAHFAVLVFTTLLDVTQVHASGNDFGQAGGEAFAKALESNTHLAELVLGSKDEPASIPLKELRDNAIDSLDYSGKKLLAEGGIVLAFALKSNTSVTKVSKQHAVL